MDIRQPRNHVIIQVQFSLVRGDGDQGGGDTFGDRASAVRGLPIVWVEISLQQNPSIADEQQAMDRYLGISYGYQPFRKFEGVEALFFRGAVLPSIRWPIVWSRSRGRSA